MCLSPHEMTNEVLERRIETLQAMVDSNRHGYSDKVKQIWRGRIRGFEAVLKERADQGVI